MLLQTSEYDRPETRLVVQAPGSIKRVFHFACREHAGNAVFFNATKVELRIEQHHLLLNPYNISVRLQSFTEIGLVFVTEALVRFLFQFRRQRIDAATVVFGWFVF